MHKPSGLDEVVPHGSGGTSASSVWRSLGEESRFPSVSLLFRRRLLLSRLSEFRRRWLGHASIQTTLDRYGHLMPNAHAAEARKLDRLVFGENGHGGAVRVTADAAQRVQNGSRDDEGVSGGNR